MPPKYKKTAPKPKTSGLGSNAFKGFTPYVPPQPPTGSYDPALNAQLGAAGRGLVDLRGDIGTANLRAGFDYGLDTQDITRQRDRGFTDIDTSRTRGLEDYGTQTAALQRSYQQLQRRQGEGARAAGVLSGGIALQAAQKRAENQGIEQQGLDTNRDRFLADNTLARGRLGEDSTLAQGRLDIGYQRGGIDRGTQLLRGEREGTQFGLDIGEQKSFQAAQSGYVPPTGPKDQGVTAAGVQYVDRPEGAYIVRYDRDGKVLSKRRRKGYTPYGTARPPGVAGLGV